MFVDSTNVFHEIKNMNIDRQILKPYIYALYECSNKLLLEFDKHKF